MSDEDPHIYKRAKGVCAGAAYPDPDPDPDDPRPKVDDVTRMNATAVHRIVYVRNDSDIKQILALARSEGKRVSVRGTKHSMGAQSICEDGIIIDMTKMTAMSYDSAAQVVACGTGCTWADLIRYLNEFGMSPRTMQSYSSFSVGGTISVNGHGITTDYTLAECIRSFRLIKWDGTDVVCSREAEGEARELFGLAIGGYGLFGVMWEVTMTVNANSRMDMEAIHVNPDEFHRIHGATREEDDVEMKLARLNIIETDNIDFFVFRRGHTETGRLISDLGQKPRELTWKSRLMYKWLMPTMKEVRYAIEKKSGAALDWSDQNERNFMMFESAAPLAQLYEPMFRVDDTFVLQEFFVPQSQFKAWLGRTNPIYAELARTSTVILLNTTIRFVKQDRDTWLPYAKAEEGMFAFVLYYRLPRTHAADLELHRFHSAFAKETLTLGGTFYLPYRHHYTQEELEQAYPRISEFVKKKESYDPLGMFVNTWFQKYCAKYLGAVYLAQLKKPMVADGSVARPLSEFGGLRVAKERRSNSYRMLLSSPTLRREFENGFLTQIFNVMDNKQLYRMIVKAARDPQNHNDLEIYRDLQRQLGEVGGPMQGASKMWKQLKQLAAQKRELVREVCSIVTRLGKFGQLHDYVSVGDAGKIVLPLREALGMRGKSWVVHHLHSDDLPVVAERGSIEPVGEAVFWELSEAGPFLGVPDASADLVTMNQGIHHLSQERLIPFIQEALRVLRPGGLFIVREHNASEELMPMLDLAHSVFNAVLGIPDKEEETEIRAFRPVLEWRQIIESVGFVDSLLYEMEPHDPTWDEMMCFYKPPLRAELRPAVKAASVDRPRPWGFAHSSSEGNDNIGFKAKKTDVEPGENLSLQSHNLDVFPPQFAALLERAPRTLFDSILSIVDNLIANIPIYAQTLKTKMKVLSAGQCMVAEQVVDQFVGPAMLLLQRFRPFFLHVEVLERDSGLFDILPRELFLIVPALLRKVEQGKASANELFAAAIIKDVQVALMGSPEEIEKEEAAKAAIAKDGGPDVSSDDVLQLMKELCDAFPQLRNPEAMGKSMGLSSRAQLALRSQMQLDGNVTMAEVSARVAEFLDEQAWNEIRGALLQAISQGIPPSEDLVFGRNGNDNPWCKALMGFLGSPHVQFRPAALAAASWVGLGDISGMWKLAQGLRKKHDEMEKREGHTGPVMPEQPRSRSEAEAKTRVKAAMEGLAPGIKEVSMSDDKKWDLKDVAEIIEAQYGYESLTARLKDVTNKVKQYVPLENNVLRLRNMDLYKTFGQSNDDVKRLADGLRKGLLNKTRYLTIKYRSSAEPSPEDFMPRINTLLDRLTALGITEEKHPEDGEYTWYKLNEWMQVEIMQIFGASLEHTSWYRFPFTQFIKIYWDALINEAGIVHKRFGPKKAFSTMGFITSLVPGIIMSIGFAQIQALALPLLAMPESTGFGESYDSRDLTEQLVVSHPADAKPIEWDRLDERIEHVRCPVEGLFVMSVPTFKGLTEIVKKFADVPNMRILEISNQRHVQVRVTTRSPRDDLRLLSQQPGCEVMFQFCYPTDGSQDQPGTTISLCVAVPYLLALVRFCDAENIELDQVYDFYC